MPADNDVRSLIISDLSGGARPDYGETSLADNELAFARDVEYRGRGLVGSRGTFASYLTLGYDCTQVEFLDVNETGEAARLYFVNATLSPRFQAPGGGAIGSAVSTFTAPSDFDDYACGAVAYNGTAYATSVRSPAAIYWNGTSWSTKTFSDFDGVGGRFPSAKHLAAHHDLIFAANIDSASAGRQRGRLRWSNALDPEQWDAEDFIDFGAGDGTGITAIVPFGEDLVVFKRNSIDLLSGRSPATFTRYSVSTTLGTRSPKTVQVMDDMLVFYDDGRGVFAFDGSGFTELSRGWTNTMRAAMGSNDDAEGAAAAAAYVKDDKYYLSLGGSLSDYNDRTFVWDRRYDAWVEWSFGFMDVGYLPGDQPSSIDPIAGTVAYRPFDSVTTTAIDDLFYLDRSVTGSSSPTYVESKYTTPWIQLAPVGQSARIRRIVTKWQYTGDWGLKVSQNVDMDLRRDMVSGHDGGGIFYENHWKSETIALPLRESSQGGSYTGPREHHVHLSDGFGSERLNYVQFEVNQSISTAQDGPAQLVSIEVVYSVLPRAKGNKDV